MNIAIVGYGRMGHEVERVALSRGHNCRAIIDPHAKEATDRSVGEAVAAARLDSETVAIEFALPDRIRETVRTYAAAGCHVVIGTTGWEKDAQYVEQVIAEAGIGCVWGANFSIGVAMFSRIAAYAGQLSQCAGGYDSAIMELHHAGKQDSPSGTALELAKHVLAHNGGKTTLNVETLHRRISSEELHVTSARVGHTPGTHTLYLDSSADTVELTHRARSRGGFAEGAVRAAEWIATRTGYFTTADLFREIFGE